MSGFSFLWLTFLPGQCFDGIFGKPFGKTRNEGNCCFNKMIPEDGL
jgi:hypothetical protein